MSRLQEMLFSEKIRRSACRGGGVTVPVGQGVVQGNLVVEHYIYIYVVMYMYMLFLVHIQNKYDRVSGLYGSSLYFASICPART